MRKLFLLIPAFLLLFSACNTQEKIMKSSDTNYKLTKANEFYAEGKWYKANEIYQGLLPVFRGTKNFEELSYRYCYTFYNMHDYLSASYQFKNFVEAFPNSSRADECEFMYATAMFQQSPRYTLDQTVTEKALAALQSYIDGHPNSPNLMKANNYIDICREKIEKKAAQTAKLYYDMQEYKAATVAYQDLIQEFPSSQKSDFYFYMKQKSYFEYANASVVTKQSERYQASIDAFNDLKQYYPQTNYLSDATTLKVDAQDRINKLKKG